MKLIARTNRAVRRWLGLPTALRSADAADSTTLLKEAGQILALFALMITVVVGLAGLAIDVTYAWREELRIQRAADAAALAGVVYLPGNVPGGVTAATAEARKNGYTATLDTSIQASQAAANPREMDVTIHTKVPTFFSRIFGVDTFDVSRTGKAVYILPVPMGSPENYYGVYGTYKMKNASGSDITVAMTSPSGGAITGRGFWGTVLTQGAGASSGDAYLPKRLNADRSGTNASHDTVGYYDYAIEMPAGSANGHVWIFDPGFCATDGRYGAGDYWLSGNDAVSTYYKLYNTNGQPYNLAAHSLLGTSSNLFAGNRSSDTRAGGPNPSGSVTSCTAGATSDPNDARYWHNKWFDLSAFTGSVLGGGQTYRLRTTTDPGDASQDSTNAYNDFSIYVTSSGSSTPKVYGVGAMEMYTPLPANKASEFYLAKIDAQQGAGKTIQIRLWDVGDTNGLPANIQILQPTGSGWSPVTGMTWTATKVSGDAASCPSGSGSSITTYSGGKLYNGCWLEIRVVVPNTYSAPMDGWWKIRYNMGSGASDMSTDLTTWQVDIRGNPVHLIP